MSRPPRFHSPQKETIERTKFYLCCVIDREIVREGLNYKEFAFRVGTTPARISNVVNKRTDKVTFNQLFRYLSVLKPKFDIMIST